MSNTSMPCASPCSVNGRSDQGHADTSTSTPSSSFAFAIRRRLISAVSSGFSTARFEPAPEQ